VADVVRQPARRAPHARPAHHRCVWLGRGWGAAPACACCVLVARQEGCVTPADPSSLRHLALSCPAHTHEQARPAVASLPRCVLLPPHWGMRLWSGARPCPPPGQTTSTW
jgi:hypothetical protein